MMRALLCCLVTAIATAAGQPASASQDKIDVVTSFTILADFARNVGGDRVAVGRRQSHVTRSERGDARSVGGDRGVVVGDPEAAGRVALAVRERGKEDRPAARIEACLQPGGVVTPVARRRRCKGKDEPHER